MRTGLILAGAGTRPTNERAPYLRQRREKRGLGMPSPYNTQCPSGVEPGKASPQPPPAEERGEGRGNQRGWVCHPELAKDLVF